MHRPLYRQLECCFCKTRRHDGNRGCLNTILRRRPIIGRMMRLFRQSMCTFMRQKTRLFPAILDENKIISACKMHTALCTNGNSTETPSSNSTDNNDHHTTPPFIDKNTQNSNKNPVEIGGPAGPEPTRYGDWQINGRVTDF